MGVILIRVIGDIGDGTVPEALESVAVGDMVGVRIVPYGYITLGVDRRAGRYLPVSHPVGRSSIDAEHFMGVDRTSVHFVGGSRF